MLKSVTRQTVCKIRNGQQNGARSLPALRKLLAVSSGEQLPELPGPPVRKDPATDYIEAEIIEPARPADIPPTLEETVRQLPHTYALTRAVTAPESYEYKQWKREQAAYARYQREQVENAPSPDMSWIIDLFNIGRALFTKKLRPASPQQLPARAAALHPSGTPGPAQQQQQPAPRWGSIATICKPAPSYGNCEVGSTCNASPFLNFGNVEAAGSSRGAVLRKHL
jgi:hypothetical protein